MAVLNLFSLKFGLKQYDIFLFFKFWWAKVPIYAQTVRHWPYYYYKKFIPRSHWQELNWVAMVPIFLKCAPRIGFSEKVYLNPAETNLYLGSSQTSMMEFFCETVFWGLKYVPVVSSSKSPFNKLTFNPF